jgi:hypothetical protein
MLNKIATRIQTRLSRKGLKVVLGNIKDYLKANVIDIENITKEEENNVTEYFLSTATKLAAIDDVALEQTEIEETLTTEDVDIVNSVDNAINTASIQDIDSSELYTNEAALNTEEETAIASNTPEELAEFYKHPALFTPNQDDQPAPLATTTKNELVANTAVSLGIQLSTTEIDQIADNFDAGSDDFSQTLEQVKGAIIAYVQHKIASNNQKITDTINEISQVASDGFEENSQTLTNGLKQLNQQLVQQSTDFKSKLAGTLSRFKLPAAS